MYYPPFARPTTSERARLIGTILLRHSPTSCSSTHSRVRAHDVPGVSVAPGDRSSEAPRQGFGLPGCIRRRFSHTRHWLCFSSLAALCAQFAESGSLTLHIRESNAEAAEVLFSTESPRISFSFFFNTKKKASQSAPCFISLTFPHPTIHCPALLSPSFLRVHSC